MTKLEKAEIPLINHATKELVGKVSSYALGKGSVPTDILKKEVRIGVIIK